MRGTVSRASAAAPSVRRLAAAATRFEARCLGEERPGDRAGESRSRLAGEEDGADAAEHRAGNQPLHGGLRITRDIEPNVRCVRAA
jgi:hypothetical protein